MPQPITNFRGEFKFLSNFHPSPILVDARWWPTLEHSYQGAKTTDIGEQESIRHCSTPGQAKRMGMTVALRPDWEEVKLDTMYCLLHRKFSDPYIRRQLLLTGDCWLEEGNTWGDTFWGVCRGCGENWLGVLLMLVRGEIRGDF